MTNSTSSPTTQKETNKFWEFRNQANSQSAELLLYGDISQSSWWGDEVTPKQFADDLAGLGDVSEITVRINSSGGDVFAADAIGNQLEQHPAAVTAKIDGLCASAATIVACHADKVIAANDAIYSYAAKMLNPNKTIQVTLRAALQSENKDGGYTYTGMRIVLGGKPKELDPGTVKRASTMDSTTTLEVTRYLIEIDGVTVVDIDKFAGRYYVDEEDQREVINALI